MIIIRLFVTFVILLLSVISAQTIAITGEGRFVILFEDGTWKYDEGRATIATESPEISKPTVSDFSIVSSSYKWDNGRFRIIGEIKNIGNIPAGVQVEAIARDASGRIVDSVKFWPNSTNNILPGQSVGIGYTVTRDKKAKRIEIQKIRVTKW